MGDPVRQIPRNTKATLVPASVTVILDHAMRSEDVFVLTPSSGGGQEVSASRVKAIDATHSQLHFHIKDNRSKANTTYTLTHKRGGGGAPPHTVFTNVPAQALLIDKEKTRPIPEKQKQYFTLRFDPPKTLDQHLKATPADYSFLGKAGSQHSGQARLSSEDSEALKTAYDQAIAVMSRRCRFVEWKFYGGGSDPKLWAPFGVIQDRSGSWQEIEGERWIYVYRRNYRTDGAAVWVDELRHTASGQIEMTPMAGLQDPRSSKAVPGKRPPPKAIGDRICFPRRIQGVAYEYFFFGTRFRLPARAIDELGRLVTNCLPPVHFEDSDRNVADIQSGECLVAVLDPITIALQLHSCYVVALNDSIGYISTYDGQGNAARKETEKRANKVLLANLIKGLTSPEADPSNQLLHKLNDAWAGSKPEASTLKHFLREHEAELLFRTNWRDRWASLLRHFFNGPLIQLLESVYLKELASEFAVWIDFCDTVLERTYESMDGRVLLDGLLAKPESWYGKYIFGRVRAGDDLSQTVRATAGGALGIMKELLPGYYQRYGLKAVEEAVQNMAKNVSEGERKLAAQILQRKYDLLGDGTTILHYQGAVVTVDAKFNRSLRFRQGLQPATITLTFALAGLNVYLAFKALADTAAKDGASAKEKALAAVGALGSFLSLNALVVEALSPASAAVAMVRVVSVLGLVSAVIDVVSGVLSTVDEWTQGNSGAAFGSAVVTAGAALGGYLAAKSLITGVAASGGAALIVAAVVAFGYAIRFLAGQESPYHKFVGHCEWGIEAGEDDAQPDWSPVPLKKLKGDFEAQMTAALNLLCTLKVGRIMVNLRAAEVKADWFPVGTRLAVTYIPLEGADQTPLNEVFVFTSKGPVATKSALEITPFGGAAYLVTRPNTPSKEPLPTELFSIREAAAKLSTVSASMEVKFDNYSFRSPKSGQVKV